MSDIILRKKNSGLERRVKSKSSTPELKIFRNGYELSKDSLFEFKHQEVYSKAYGKPKAGYHIHHIDHNKLNNHIDNLISIPSQVHKYIHYISSNTGNKLSRFEIEKELKLYEENIQAIEVLEKEIYEKNIKLKKLEYLKEHWKVSSLWDFYKKNENKEIKG